MVSQATLQVRQAEGATLVDYRKIMQTIVDLVEDSTLDAENLRTRLRSIIKEAAPHIHSTHAAAVRSRLTDKMPAVRSLLRQLTELPIDAAPGERAVLGLKQLKNCMCDMKLNFLPESMKSRRVGKPTLMEKRTERRRCGLWKCRHCLSFVAD